MLSKRIIRVNESATMKFAAETIKLQSQGIDIINFGIGEPDFNTPDVAKNAAIKAIAENKTHYTLTSGIVPLRQAISNSIKEDYQIDYSADEIIVTNGAKQALFNTLMVLVDHNDEIIIPTPCWPTYPEIINLTGGKAVFIDTDISTDFKITPQQLRDSITSKTKVMLFCNPSNPTGTVYNKDEVKALMEVLKNTNIYIISDEIYGKLIYDNYDYISLGRFKNELKDRVIVLQGASKAYAMTGWRLGFAAGPKDVIKACELLQSHSTSNVSSISQYAAKAAFTNAKNELLHMHDAFNERRKYVISFFEKIPGLLFAVPHGAFYIFPQINAFYGTAADGSSIKNSTDLTMYLLKEAHVAVVPGYGFRSEDHIRISYATSMDLIKNGLDMINSALNKIRKE